MYSHRVIRCVCAVQIYKSTERGRVMQPPVHLRATSIKKGKTLGIKREMHIYVSPSQEGGSYLCSSSKNNSQQRKFHFQTLPPPYVSNNKKNRWEKDVVVDVEVAFKCWIRNRSILAPGRRTLTLNRWIIQSVENQLKILVHPLPCLCRDVIEKACYYMEEE